MLFRSRCFRVPAGGAFTKTGARSFGSGTPLPELRWRTCSPERTWSTATRAYSWASWAGPTSEEQDFRDSVDSLRSHIRQLEATVDGLEFMQEPSSSPAQTPTHTGGMRDVTVHVHGGSVNFGNIRGDVKANVANIAGPKAEELKGLMNELAVLISTSPQLDAESRETAAEALEVLSEGVKTGPGGKPGALLKSAVRRLPSVLSALDEGRRLWEQALPLIKGYLPGDLFQRRRDREAADRFSRRPQLRPGS